MSDIELALVHDLRHACRLSLGMRVFEGTVSGFRACELSGLRLWGEEVVLRRD